jgi:tetratricopeptide (TPR) repeat protein
MRQRAIAGAIVSSVMFAYASPPLAVAQMTMAGIRGRVIDESGSPVAGVVIDMEFKGESRKKVTRSQVSDKRGGFVRMGVPDGRWQVTFTKPGYQTYVMEIQLSLGGFSEAGDIVLKAAPAAADTTAAPSGELHALSAPGEGSAAPAEQAALERGYAAALEAAKTGRHDEAEAGIKEVLAKYPDLASAHFNLGYVYRMKKDWKAAEGEYARVTELEPSNGDAFVALAAVREADGRAPEATEALLAAAPAFATDARFQHALGITCVNAGRSTEAAAAFRKAIELDPANAEAHYQLATVLVGQAKTAEAVSMLETYLGMAAADAPNAKTAKALLTALKK